MRVVLFGGLTTLLAGLVALGAVLVSERRPRPMPPAEEEADEPAPPPSSGPRKNHERRLPSIVAADCAPQPGRACWRGRLRLSAAVRAAWLAARGGRGRLATASRDLNASASVSDDDTEEITTDDDGDLQRGVARRQDDVGVGSLQPAEDQSTALPPESSFGEFFEVRAVPWDDQPGDLPRLPRASRAAGDVTRLDPMRADAGSGQPPALEAVVARVSFDGTFDLEVLPGRYDVVVTADDNFLVGGMDGLDARAGDARGGLDLVLVLPVALAGRILDDDGVSVDGSIEIRDLHHQDEPVAYVEAEQGRFLVDDLRPGQYLLVGTSHLGDRQTVQVTAPLSGIELRFARLPDALLLVGPANDSGTGNRCPSGTIVLTSQDDRQERRRAWMQRCRGVLPHVRPGSTWRVAGRLGAGDPNSIRLVDTVITFGGGKPVPPVCLAGNCRTDVADLAVRVVDSAGNPVPSAGVEVLSATDEALPPGRLLDALSPGLRAGTTLTLRARAADLEATVTTWLAVGVNDLLIRLPGRVPTAD